MVGIGKANYVIILDHFVSLITICYHYHYPGSNPAGTTNLISKLQTLANAVWGVDGSSGGFSFF